jgi:hypothetical protein
VIHSMNLPGRSEKPKLLWMVGTGVVFGLGLLIFFYPLFLSGGVLIPLHGDAAFWYYAMYQRILAGIRQGELFLWNPLIFSGFPALGDLANGLFYWPHLLLLWLLNNTAWAQHTSLLLSYAVAFIFTTLFARDLRLTLWGAWVAAFIYTFSGHLLLWTFYPAQMISETWMPVVFFFSGRALTSERLGSLYIVATALAVATQIAAGHPQVPLYSTMAVWGFLLFRAVQLRRELPGGFWRALARPALAFLAGLMLIAPQVLPTLELAGQSFRFVSMSFDAFADNSIRLPSFLQLLIPLFHGGTDQVPFWGPHWHLFEMGNYLGILPLALATGVSLFWVHQRNLASLPTLGFWVVLWLLSAWILLGRYGGLAQILYHVPVYNKFRCPDRHWLHFNWAVALLAGHFFTLWQDPAYRTRLRSSALWGGVLFFSAALVLALAVRWLPQGVQWLLESLSLPGQNALKSWQEQWFLILGRPLVWMGGGLFLFWVFSSFRPQILPLVLLIFVVLDLAHFAHVFLPKVTGDPRVLEATTGAALPPELQGEAERSRYFKLSYPPDQSDPHYFYGWPMVDGYNQFLLDRYARLTGLTYYGFLEPGDTRLLNPQNQTLSLLSTRYLLLPSQQQAPPISLGGISFAREPLRVDLPGGQKLRLYFPEPFRTTEVGLVSALAFSGGVEDKTSVARLTLRSASGVEESVEVLAGRDTSEWAWERPDVRKVVKHARAPIAESSPADAQGSFQALHYLFRHKLSQPIDIEELSIESLLPGVLFHMTRLSLLDEASGGSRPITPLDLLQRPEGGWTFRGTVPSGHLLYETYRFFPRARLVWKTREKAAEEIRTAIQTGQDPQGQPFNLETEALVEGFPTRDFGSADPQAQVRFTEFSANRLAVTTETRSPAFLVLSEVIYPGWEALVDGKQVPIITTNYLLRGLPVPAGQHRVELLYRPASLRWGWLIATLTGIGLVSTLVGVKRLDYSNIFLPDTDKGD